MRLCSSGCCKRPSDFLYLRFFLQSGVKRLIDFMRKITMKSYNSPLNMTIVLLGLLCLTSITMDTQTTVLAASLPTSYTSSSPEFFNEIPHQNFASSYPKDSSDHLFHTFQLAPWERANAVAFSPNGKILAVASSSGIHLYDIRTFDEIRFIKTDSWARSIDFSPDGEILAAGIFDNSIRLWRTSDGVLLKSFEGHSSWVRSVAFTSDGTILASASDDNTVRLWRVVDGTTLYTLSNHTQGVRCIAFSPDDAVLASGTEDGSIWLWRVGDGTLLNTLEGHSGWVRTLAFSHDGQALASGAFDSTARLWRIADGTLLHTLEGHTASVLGVSFSPDDEIIATGSVDTTIGLWHTSDGSVQNILKGHTDFIYSVAFSPDGKLLASGSEDNTVRLWDLKEAKTSMEASWQETDGDCRVCHHPGITMQAVPVVEVRCDACHLAGAGFNWCPVFPRSLEDTHSTTMYPASVTAAGLPIGNESLGITINTPSNGETIYSHWEFGAPMLVTGQVLLDKIQGTDPIDVQLEVWSGLDQIASHTTQAFVDGYFTFPLGLNPRGSAPLSWDPSVVECALCHANYKALSFLPSGEIRLIVIATTPTGEQVRDERWITVDVSEAVEFDVRVKNAMSGQPASGLIVQAETMLYEWRERRTNAITNKDGLAKLRLEALSQMPTSYRISVPEQVMEGRLYFSEQVQQVVFPTEANSIQPIEFFVHAQTGKIEGQLENEKGLPIDSVPVLAVRLPEGPGYRSNTTVDGFFTFTDLPISKYILFPDPDTLAMSGLESTTRVVDLSQSSQMELALSAVPVEGISLRGVVRDNENRMLPFIWLQYLSNGQTESTSPDSGTWMFRDIPQGQQEFLVQAPGYYSQSLSIEAESGSEAGLDIILLRRSETQVLAWGEGEIVIPPESKAEIRDHQITFQSGWIWGQGERKTPFVIKTPEAVIELRAANFALERLLNKTSWFCLMEGQAVIRPTNSNESEMISSGTCVALVSEGPLSLIPIEPTMMRVLRTFTEPPLAPMWKPNVLNQLQEYLRHLGIVFAQVITLITYIVAVLSLVLAPLLAVRWMIRNRKDIMGNK
jgi:WD40 repeat protein